MGICNVGSFEGFPLTNVAGSGNIKIYPEFSTLFPFVMHNDMKQER